MSEVVRNYYNAKVQEEWKRLTSPYRRFELLSTLQLVESFFPSHGRIADIGGGPGRYTIGLLERGYQVTLVDLSDENVAFARERLLEANVSADAVLAADARELSQLETSSFDAALCLGPMYHLVDQADRARALKELHRVLKPGAPAIVGFINPWGVLRAGLTEFPDFYSDESSVHQLLDVYIKAGEQSMFTESAFIPPPQALEELRAASFAVECRVGVEGFAAGCRDQILSIEERDPAAYDVIAKLVPTTAHHPAFRDCTEHLHVVVRKIA